MIYEFTFANGTVAFDWGTGMVSIKARHGRKVGDEEYGPVEGEYSFEELPLFTSFFVTGMSALYGTEQEVRGKMVISTEGFVLEMYRAKNPGKAVAFLLAYDTKKKQSSVFLFNRPNLYAFLQMIKSVDKVVSVRDIVWERINGELYVNRLHVPFQKVKVLEWVLMEGLKEGRYPSIRQEWSGGSMSIRGNRLSFFRNREGKQVPFFSLSLKDPIDVFRMLSCL